MIFQVSRRNWVERDDWRRGGRRFGQAGEGKSIDQVMESELDAEQGEEGDDIRSYWNRGLQELTKIRSRFILWFFHLAWNRMIWPKNRHPNYVATRQVTAGAVEEEEEEEEEEETMLSIISYFFGNLNLDPHRSLPPLLKRGRTSGCGVLQGSSCSMTLPEGSNLWSWYYGTFSFPDRSWRKYPESR